MKRLLFALCAILALSLVIPDIAAAQRRNPPAGGGSGGGSVATPRGGGSSGGSQGSPPSSGGGAVTRGGSSGGGSQVAPAQARPRGDRPVYGQAVPRSQAPGGGRIIIPSRYFGVSPWYYYSPYAYGAFGLGYWGWDPYWWGGYPYWGNPYYGYPYGRYYGRYSDYDREYRDYGSIKLKVKPREAQVYVDGYYMGQVDDFDGVFQELDVEAGTHRIEIRATGYQPLVFELRVSPGRTVNYRGQLVPARVER